MKMKNSTQNLTLLLITSILLCTAETTKCPDEYEKVPTRDTTTHTQTHDVEINEEEMTAEQINQHNDNATKTLNKYLPPKAQQVNLKNSQVSMDGGLDLDNPAKNRAPGDLGGGKSLGENSLEITNKDGSKTITTYDPTSKITTNTNFDHNGKQLNSVLSSVKSGLFSRTSNSTVIQHHDNGTHTVTKTSTNHSLFGTGTPSISVTHIDTKGNAKDITPSTKTSRQWNGNTTTTIKYSDGSTSIETKNLFGKTLNKSGANKDGTLINQSDIYTID